MWQRSCTGRERGGRMRKHLAVIPMLALLSGPMEIRAKDKRQERKSAPSGESRGRTEPGRDEWKHKGQGHFPHDANGDGMVNRREWPGSDDSFRRLDRNGDGVLSEADRKLQGDKRYYESK